MSSWALMQWRSPFHWRPPAPNQRRPRLADALGAENAGSLLDTPGPEAV